MWVDLLHRVPKHENFVTVAVKYTYNSYQAPCREHDLSRLGFTHTKLVEKSLQSSLVLQETFSALTAEQCCALLSISSYLLLGSSSVYSIPRQTGKDQKWWLSVTGDTITESVHVLQEIQSTVLHSMHTSSRDQRSWGCQASQAPVACVGILSPRVVNKVGSTDWLISYSGS